MRGQTRAICCILLAVPLILLMTGCSVSRVKPPPPPSTSSHPSGSAPSNPMDQIEQVKGRGWYLPWYTRDPRNPNGPPIPVLIATAATGEINNRDGNPEILMRQVHARLYQKGQHAANVVAATITANQNDQTIIGKGGCTVTSLLNPSDTVLTADTITWDTNNTKFVAEGHAHVVRRPRDGGVPITQEGGTIIYDLEHNTIEIQ